MTRPGPDDVREKLPPVLTILTLTSFTTALSTRALDPVVPHIAEDLSVTIATAASLTAGAALSFAVVQPILGAAADVFGKARLMLICLALLGLANLAGAFATNYPTLMATRILCGIGSGGVFPIAMSLVGDLVPMRGRQVGLSRILSGYMAGNLLGSSFAGVTGDLIGWRGVLALLGLLVFLGGAISFFGLRAMLRIPRGAVDLARLRTGYISILSHRNTPICYAAVFIEGVCVLGVLPFIAAFLTELGEPRLSIAGVVIAGLAIGGLIYTQLVPFLLPKLGITRIMMAGGVIAGTQLAAMSVGLSWPYQFVSMIVLGSGFYMLHGSLQVYATALSEEARASALALHSFFFFFGQAVGPVVYGLSLATMGKTPSLLAAAVIIVATGFVSAVLLGRTRVQ